MPDTGHEPTSHPAPPQVAPGAPADAGVPAAPPQASQSGPSTETGALAPGTRVEVRERFAGKWARGFEIAEVDSDGYRLRRIADGSLLPTRFAPDVVRKERKRGTWWY